MSKEKRADYVLTSVWEWLQEMKAYQYVPWSVSDPNSRKHIEQVTRDSILSDLDTLIHNKTSESRAKFPDGSVS